MVGREEVDHVSDSDGVIAAKIYRIVQQGVEIKGDNIQAYHPCHAGSDIPECQANLRGKSNVDPQSNNHAVIKGILPGTWGIEKGGKAVEFPCGGAQDDPHESATMAVP